MKETILAVVMSVAAMVGCVSQPDAEEKRVFEVTLEDIDGVEDIFDDFEANRDVYDSEFGVDHWTVTYRYDELSRSGWYTVEDYQEELYR